MPTDAGQEAARIADRTNAIRRSKAKSWLTEPRRQPVSDRWAAILDAGDLRLQQPSPQNLHHREMDTLLGIAAAAVILVICAVVTNWFSNNMYRRCRECGTLNARRRTACRQCGHSFETGPM